MSMSSISTIQEGCAVCFVPTTRLCSACKLVKYCSTDHQRQHWNKHKKLCRPFRIGYDDILGRHLMATRDIKANSVIFVEEALVVGPKWYVSEHNDQQTVMPCLICNTPCHMNNLRCLKCQWPICSTKCAKQTERHSIECKVLALGSGPKNQNEESLLDYYRSDALLVLKCLVLQKQNPEKWKALMNMQSHEEERKNTELQQVAEKRIAAYLEQNYFKYLKRLKQKPHAEYLNEYDSSVIHRICGIIETNYMCINASTGLELSGLFHTACMMEHSCIPNCYFLFDESNQFRISVIAGRDIKKAEHLKIMYTNMLWATQMRNEHLLMTKHFMCSCARCSDPTELGTHFSSLRCLGDENRPCDGVQLPKNPLNCNTDWACNKCNLSLSGAEIQYMLTQMTEQVESLLANKPTIKQVESLLKKFEKFFHPHHYNMFSLKHTLIQMYGNDKEVPLHKLTEDLLTKKVDLCNELWDICLKLDPHSIRLSIYAAIILYEKYTVFLEKYKRLKDDKMVISQDSIELSKNLIVQAEDCLVKASILLKKELDNVAGTQLNKCIQQAIDNLKKKIKNQEPCNS